MKKKYIIEIFKNIGYIFILSLVIIYTLKPNIVFGENFIWDGGAGGGINNTPLDDIISKGDDFLDAADENTNTIDEGDLQELSGFISGVLLSIAIGVTIISGVILGIKFVTQSIEDKAKIKESMVPWVIGILVSFGAFTIWEIAVNVFQNL